MTCPNTDGGAHADRGHCIWQQMLCDSHQVGFGGFWWILVGFGGFWWLLVGFGGFWWVLVDFSGFWWVLVDFSGFGWILVGFGWIFSLQNFGL